MGLAHWTQDVRYVSLKLLTASSFLIGEERNENSSPAPDSGHPAMRKCLDRVPERSRLCKGLAMRAPEPGWESRFRKAQRRVVGPLWAEASRERTAQKRKGKQLGLHLFLMMMARKQNSQLILCLQTLSQGRLRCPRLEKDRINAG